MQSEKLLNQYFPENRSHVLELAAFFDRLEKAELSPDHPKLQALRKALSAVLDPNSSLGCRGSSRVLAVQLILSDPSEEPLESAPPEKSATGVPRCC